MPSLPGVLKVYGGWINLDDKPQFFSCVLGSHRPGDTSSGGFVPVSEEEALEIKTRKLSTKIEIPPGGILIFQGETVTHVQRRACTCYRGSPRVRFK